jgi:hypothetical protein
MNISPCPKPFESEIKFGQFCAHVLPVIEGQSNKNSCW